MLRKLLATTLFVLGGTGSAFSQAVNATLLGSVTDIAGGIIAGAKITITETNTGVSKNGFTNASGNYTFPDLQPGVYSVTAEHPGFKKETRRDLTVNVNSSVRADLQLQPGSVSETIEITAAPAILQTDRADTGRLIDSEMIEELPL